MHFFKYLEEYCKVKWRENNWHYFLYGISIFAIISYGVYLRTSNYFHPSPSLWLDESWRILDLLEAKNVFLQALKGSNNIDPFLYNLCIYFLSKIYNTESVLRLTSLIPSILSTFVFYLISIRIFKNKIIIIWSVFLVSLHPVLIDYAKELKPYSWTLLIHLCLLYLLLKIYKSEFTIKIYFLPIGLIILFLLSTNIVFMFPSIYLLFLIISIKKQNKVETIKLFLSAIIILGILILYSFMSDINYEGLVRDSEWKNYFNLNASMLMYVRWNLSHLFQLIDGFIISSDPFNMRKTVYIIFIIMYFISLISFIKNRKYEYLIILFVPLLIMSVFNRWGMWPWGYIRSNIFMFGYIVFPVLFAVDKIISNLNIELKYSVFGFIIFILIAQYPYETERFKRKNVGIQEIKLSLNYLYEKLKNKKEKEPQYLLMKQKSRYAFSYYSK